MLDITEMKRSRRQKINEAKKMLDNADRQNRDLSQSERQTFEDLSHEIDCLADQIEIDEARQSDPTWKALHGFDGEYVQDEGFVSKKRLQHNNGAEILRDPETGREVRAYAHGEPFRFADRQPLPDGIRGDELSIGRFLRGQITGDWKGAEAERRALSVGSQSAGGFLVPDVMSESIINAARVRMAVSAAGARVVEMPSSSVDLAKVTSEPSASWVAENTAISEGEPAFGKIQLRSRICAVYTPVSEVLVRSASNVESTIRDILSFAVAKALDYAALYGDGQAQEPLGIYNTDNVQSTDKSAGALAMDDVITAYWSIMDNNPDTDQLSILYNSDIGEKLSTLKDGEGRYLLSAQGGIPDIWGKCRRFVTNQIATASSQADIFVGDFRQVLIGVQDRLIVDITRHTTGAFQKNQLWIKAVFLGDVALARENHFYIIKNAAA